MAGTTGVNEGAMDLDELILKLYDIDAVKFGNFRLKSGLDSPAYFDLRVIVSFPELMPSVAEHLWRAAQNSEDKFVSVCGVPYTALPIATVISVNHNLPMLIRRKEAKDYGTKKLIEGRYNEGDLCLIVEDVVTSGSSVMETVEALKSVGIQVKDAVVLLEREQGGKTKLKQQGINLHSVISMTKLLDTLLKNNKIDQAMADRVHKFIRENRFDVDLSSVSPSVGDGDVQTSVPKSVEDRDAKAPLNKKSKKDLKYAERARLCSHPVSQQLFSIMEEKRSNLAISVDLTKSQDIINMVEKVGPYVCLVKTHIDIVEDFSPALTQQLSTLAKKHNFLIFEDRKFADIGNTVQHQYSGGVYRIADWAHVINAHAVPGPGVVQGLKKVGVAKSCGCLLIAEMSSAGSLATGSYTKESVSIAEAHKDFVIGFICQSRVSQDPDFIHMVPGVKLSEGSDSLGQQYVTPKEAVVNRHADVIIVGRGILQAVDPVQAAKEYQEAGFQAYQDRVS